MKIKSIAIGSVLGTSFGVNGGVVSAYTYFNNSKNTKL